MPSRGVNKVILVGNLGQDPEFRTIPSGTPVCTLRLATTERFKDKNGELQDRTEWHNVVVWRRLAEVARDYLKKGSGIYLEGKIQYRNYEDKQGVTRYVTDIVADNFIMLDSKGGGSGQQNSRPSDNSQNDQENSESLSEEDLDDEVPF